MSSRFSHSKWNIQNGYDIILKIATSGEGCVGKTSLLERYVNNSFSDHYDMTIGVNMYSKKYEGCSLILWDFGGQERFRFLLKSYINGVNGALYMFDMTKIKTLECINEWIPILRSYDNDIPIILVGTKVDLVDKSEFQIYKSLIANIREKYNLLDYFETSSKSNINIQPSVEMLVDNILKTKHQCCLSDQKVYPIKST